MADGLHFDDGLLEWAETFGATPVDAADDLLFTATSLLEDSSLNMAHTSAAPRYPDAEGSSTVVRRRRVLLPPTAPTSSLLAPASSSSTSS